MGNRIDEVNIYLYKINVVNIYSYNIDEVNIYLDNIDAVNITTGGSNINKYNKANNNYN